MTKQIDIDLYGDLGGKIEVKGMKADIEVVLERMRRKNPSLVSMPKDQVQKVNITDRLNILNIRGKPPIIYHQVTASRPYSTINVQIETPDLNPITTDMVIMARHAKMPIGNLFKPF